MFGGRWTGILSVSFLLMTGRAAAAPPSGASPGHRLVDVPYLAQTAELCGGAALAMVKRYWGDRTVLPGDYRSLVTSSAGIVTSDLARAAGQGGWRVAAGEGTGPEALSGLQQDVDLGQPVIVLLRLSPGHFHYVVVVGVTDALVVFHDPARSAFLVSRSGDFDRLWSGAHRWSLLVLPPLHGIVTDRPTRAGSEYANTVGHARSGPCGALVDRGVALSQSDLQGAEAALSAARDLCPLDADPWLELAGLRFRESRWTDAAELAERAVSLDPSNRDAWTLLGAARFMSDDKDGALGAWNQTGAPPIDVVTVTGAHWTPQPSVQRLIGLEPRTILTPAAFNRAARQFSETPTAEATRLSFTPLDDGRATVSAAMVERDRWPRGPFSLIAIGAQSLVDDDLRVTLSDLAGQGETLAVDWRWPTERPRVGAMLTLPAPNPLAGVVTLDGFWEEQSYGLPAGGQSSTVVRDSRRHVSLNVGTWLSGATRLDFGTGLDRFGTQDYLSLHGAVEEHVAGDRIVARIDAETWQLGHGGPFGAGSALVRWSSTTDITQPTWSTSAGMSTASALAPRALWMGAGIGQGRPVLLRAHPLLTDNVVRGPVFGRDLAFSTSEYRHPLRRTPVGVLSVAGFVDAAQAWHGLSSRANSPFEVDAGAGLRLSTFNEAGEARLDIAQGLRDGGLVVSAGWTVGLGVPFSRKTPW